MLQFQSICCPLDFSESTSSIYNLAIQLAVNSQAEINLISIVPATYQGDIAEYGFLGRFVEEAYAQSEADLKVVVDKMKADYPFLIVHSKVLKNNFVAPAILEYLQENNIDLVIMGTHGRRGLEKIFMGSVAEEVLKKATCPVLTLRIKA